MIDLSQLFGSGSQFGDWSAAPGAGGGVRSGDILGGASAAASLAGGITGAIGAEQAAAAQARGYEQNALTAGINAGITRSNVFTQQRVANYQLNRLYGRQRAGYAAAGASAASGSPLDVMADTSEAARQEALIRFHVGDTAAQSADLQSSYDRQAAAAARSAGDTTAFGDILSGVGNAAMMAAKIFML